MPIVDNYGRVVFDSDELFELLYEGHEVDSRFLLADGQQYNEFCRRFDKLSYILPEPEPLDHSPEDEHLARQGLWFIPDEYKKLDVWKMLTDRCSSDEEQRRLNHEKILYEERNLNDLLRLMIYLVDHFRERNIVWGVGRGSSVASLALYLIGITKINPLKYGLDIEDFLKD